MSKRGRLRLFVALVACLPSITVARETTELSAGQKGAVVVHNPEMLEMAPPARGRSREVDMSSGGKEGGNAEAVGAEQRSRRENPGGTKTGKAKQAKAERAQRRDNSGEKKAGKAKQAKTQDGKDRRPPTPRRRRG